MATIQIHPIEVYSNGRHRVVITGISPTDYDCIVGELYTKMDGPVHAVWDLSGLMRGGQDAFNLNMGDEELQGIANLALQLGAKR